MRRKLFTLLILTLISLHVFSQKDDPVVFKINGKPVFWSEVKPAYDKGNKYAEVKEPLKDFIRSYAIFRSNIEEARSQGIDTTAAFKASYRSFKDEIADAYMETDTVYENEYLRKTYERLKENIDINHVMIPFDSELVLPKDTMAVYERALELRRMIIENRFEIDAVLAYNKPYALMRRTIDRNGHIGWITAFMLPFNVENVVYSLPINEISMPIRSSKGYHIVQVLNKRPAVGSVEVEQVMFNFPHIPAPENQRDSVWEVAQRVYEGIHTHEDYNRLCAEFAEAHKTGDKGCYFGMVGLDSNLPPDFTMGAYNLDKPGDVSQPVMTPYGYHILRLLRKIDVPPYDKIKGELRNRIIKSDKVQELNDGSREMARKNYKIEVNAEAYDKLKAITSIASPRDSLFLSKIDNKNDLILNIDDKRSYRVSEFAKYLNIRQRELKQDKNELSILRVEETSPYSLSTDLLKEYFDSFVAFLLEDYAKYTLEERNQTFKEIMDNYSNDVLVYEVKNRNIWDRSKNDEEGLKKYFSKNKSKYSLEGQKYKGLIVYAKNEDLLNEAQSILKSTASTEEFIKSLRNTVNKDSVVVMIEPGLWSKGNNEFVDNKIFGGDAPKKPNKRYPFFFLTGRFIDKPEDYADVRSAVEKDYQEKLEKDWDAYLSKKYKIEYNNSVINKLE